MGDGKVSYRHVRPALWKPAQNCGDFLQEIGDAGWELVSVTTEGENGPDTSLTTLYLKREKIAQL